LEHKTIGVLKERKTNFDFCFLVFGFPRFNKKCREERKKRLEKLHCKNIERIATICPSRLRWLVFSKKNDF